MIWFARVLRHINHCRLLNAKPSLYMYIKYMLFLNERFAGNILKESELKTVKSFKFRKQLHISFRPLDGIQTDSERVPKKSGLLTHLHNDKPSRLGL